MADVDRCCWICLGESGPLSQPCGCKARFVHVQCLAKWQLTSAGREEERHCRFCHQQLPDWRPTLTPEQLKPASSVMSVRYRGVTHRITYTPGPDGLEQFLATLNAIGIKVASASQVTFLCRTPDTGEEMALKGLKAFDAAAYCASITAAKRLQRDSSRRAPSDCGVQPDGPCDRACVPASVSMPPASSDAPDHAAWSAAQAAQVAEYNSRRAAERAARSSDPGPTTTTPSASTRHARASEPSQPAPAAVARRHELRSASVEQRSWPAAMQRMISCVFSPSDSK